jgi:ferredoxin
MLTMAYVITQPCIGSKDESCVEVCPVDCIHSDDSSEMNFIDPEACIDCGACVDACPVDAIYPEDAVPVQWRSFIQLNGAFYGA